MVSIQVEWVGLADVIARYESRRAMLNDLTPELDAAVEGFGEAEENYFATEGAGSWAALTPGTDAYRAQEGEQGPVLTRSGELRASLRNPTVFSRTARGVTAGTAVPYAHFHQDGFRQRWFVSTDATSGRLSLALSATSRPEPARKPIDLSLLEWWLISDRFFSRLIERLAAA